jgi:hypothetical protein
MSQNDHLSDTLNVCLTAIEKSILERKYNNHKGAG